MQPQVETTTPTATVTNSAPYFQWGRKDPFKGMGTVGSNSNYGAQSLAHQNPTRFYNPTSSGTYNWTIDKYNYFWDVDNTGFSTDSPVVKTIYDPCPAGWNVPQYNTFTGFTKTGSYETTSSKFNVIGSFDKGWKFKRNAADATGLHFPAAGDRDSSSASISDVTSYGYWWLSIPSSSTYGHYLNFLSGRVNPQDFNYRSYGYCVWPALSQN